MDSGKAFYEAGALRCLHSLHQRILSVPGASRCSRSLLRARSAHKSPSSKCCREPEMKGEAKISRALSASTYACSELLGLKYSSVRVCGIQRIHQGSRLLKQPSSCFEHPGKSENDMKVQRNHSDFFKTTERHPTQFPGISSQNRLSMARSCHHIDSLTETDILIP